MRILAAQLNFIIGDFPSNCDKIIAAIQRGKELHADLVVFSELALSGYPPEDFLLQHEFMEAVENTLLPIMEASKGIAVIVGLPRRNLSKQEKGLFNSAAIIQDGQLLGFQDKILLPTYDVFDEKRYFEPGQKVHLWEIAGKCIAVTICEDIWQGTFGIDTQYHRDPIMELQGQKVDCIVNLSASPYSIHKQEKRSRVCMKAARALKCPLVLCNQVGGNDSLIFDGQSLYVSSEGKILASAKGFEEDFLYIDVERQESGPISTYSMAENLYKALVLGVRDYFEKLGFQHACLGLSGGIDSAVVACIAAEALGPQNVLGVSMPSHYSSKGSVEDAEKLASHLGILYRSIPIEDIFKNYLHLLTPEFEGKPTDVTEENLQARIRGMILMSLSNKHGYIVLSTGNKSELAVGYSTLYGDLCGGLAMISDVSKRQVYALANWINRDREIIPQNSIQKAPSAELRPNQLDSDSLPDYDILDNILEAYIEQHESAKTIADKHHYPLPLVEEIIRKMHFSEYKRRQSPPGLRVTEKAFTFGRRFPIVQKFIR